MKNSVKRLINLFVAAALILVVAACSEDDPAPAPSVSAPASADVNVGAAATVSFTVTIPGGFASASATQTGGTAEITTNLTAGDLEGTIVVTFTAGSTAGAGSVTLTVTDAEGQSDDATAVLNIQNSDAPSVTAPAAQEIQVGSTATMTFTVSTPGGYASSAVTANDGTATITSEPAADATTGDVVVELSGAAIGPKSVTLTVTDGEGQTDDATAVVTVLDATATFTVTEATEIKEISGADVEFKQNMIAGIINKDFTMTADKAWILNGRVIVGNNATLTIEPGTIVKGTDGTGAAASVLLVARGGKIMADGTESNPIVFTTIYDNINVGEFNSTLDLSTDLGYWGGVLILGKAPIVASAAEKQIEGIPSSVTEGLYGGTVADDNSGSLTYVSIRFTGQELGPGNELQGLTLGGVGSETTISNVESINSADDGVEIFGGTVNISNFIVLNPDDDGFDTDQGWSGTATNIVYIGQEAGAGWDSDHAFELDGPEGTDAGDPEIGKFKGGTAWGRNASDFADLRDGAQYDMQDIYFFGFKAGLDLELDADGSDDGAGGSLSDDPTNSDNYANDIISFSGNEFNQVDVDGNTTFTDINKILNDKLSGTLVPAKASQITNNETVKFPANNSLVTTATKTKGADISGLGWSYTSALGLFAGADFQ